jgi:hypothetical protein
MFSRGGGTPLKEAAPVTLLFNPVEGPVFATVGWNATSFKSGARFIVPPTVPGSIVSDGVEVKLAGVEDGVGAVGGVVGVNASKKLSLLRGGWGGVRGGSIVVTVVAGTEGSFTA